MKEKTIGILGGMGPEATIFLFQKILENTAASRDQEHARIIIDNNPKIPERLPAIMGTGKNPLPMMIKSAQSLQNAGADFIVMPCVSAHYFLSALQKRIKLPILSMIEETASFIEAQRPKISRVGLLAALGTIRTGIFQRRLEEDGIQTLIAGKQDLQKGQANIFKIKNTKGGYDRRIIRAEIKKIGNKLIKKGAQGIIIGCTELSLIIHPQDFPVPVYDALILLARAAIREAGVQLT